MNTLQEGFNVLFSKGLRLEQENQQLKELLKEACEVIKHYDYPDVGMEGNIIIKSGCVANDFINQPKVKAILSNQ